MTAVEVEQGRVGDHDSTFARGVHVGYALGMAAVNHGFLRWLPITHLAAVRHALRPYGGRLTVRSIEAPNHFSVRFVHLQVDFPAVSTRPTARGA